MARIKDIQALRKDMVVQKNDGVLSQTIVLTSDPYEKLKGEWFINTALQSDPNVTETLYLPKYGFGGTFSEHSLEN